MILEVRCCCRPEKLLGWIDVGASAERVVFALRPAAGSPFDADLQHTEHIELPIAKIRIDGKVYRAVKAEGTPIEILRRIAGFREAT